VRNTLSSKLKLDDSALDADHGGMRSVVGTQFGKDAPDLSLNGFFADRKLRSTSDERSDSLTLPSRKCLSGVVAN
jgi:hypothetical protein